MGLLLLGHREKAFISLGKGVLSAHNDSELGVQVLGLGTKMR